MFDTKINIDFLKLVLGEVANIPFHIVEKIN